MEQSQEREEESRAPLTCKQMTYQFLKTSIPLVVRQNLTYAVLLVNVIFAGRLNDPAKMAGVGLGTTMNHILGLCILFGMNNAMDTLIT